MILQLNPIYDADNGEVIRFDVNVCAKKHGEAELFLFVDSFAPTHPIRDMQRKAENFLERATTKKLIDEFVCAIDKLGNCDPLQQISARSQFNGN